MGDKLGCTTLVEHEIKTEHTPIKQRYYPVSPTTQQHIDKELNKLLRGGVIAQSTSPWLSSVLLVRKKDKNYRFCVNFRKLNQITEPDAYPLPYISAILDKLRGAKYLSSWDALLISEYLYLNRVDHSLLLQCQDEGCINFDAFQWDFPKRQQLFSDLLIVFWVQNLNLTVLLTWMTLLW